MIDVPKIYTRPWVLATINFKWIPNQELDEQLCVPSEAIMYTNVISNPAFGALKIKVGLNEIICAMFREVLRFDIATVSQEEEDPFPRGHRA